MLEFCQLQNIVFSTRTLDSYVSQQALLMHESHLA